MSTALGCALLAYLNVQGHQARLAWVRAVEKAGLTARLDYNIWLVGLPSWLQAPLVQRLLAREIAIVEVNGQDDLTKLITCKRPSADRTCVYITFNATPAQWAALSEGVPESRRVASGLRLRDIPPGK